jgi:hypothetical protein
MENLKKSFPTESNNLNDTMNELIPQFILNELNSKEEKWSLQKLRDDTSFCDMSYHQENNFNIDQHNYNQQVNFNYISVSI